MPNKIKFELSQLAQNDLEDVWIYTVKNWSINQANRYYKLIIEEINALCSNPEIGKSISKIKKLHRVLPIKSHLIIYKIANDTIWIDRVLHKSMDIDTHLND